MILKIEYGGAGCTVCLTSPTYSKIKQYYSILDKYESLHLCDWTAVYRTVRTVVWEVGHTNNGWPPTRLNKWWEIYWYGMPNPTDIFMLCFGTITQNGWAGWTPLRPFCKIKEFCLITIRIKMPSRILMVTEIDLDVMYNNTRFVLPNQALQSRIFPNPPMLSVRGRRHVYAGCGEFPLG